MRTSTSGPTGVWCVVHVSGLRFLREKSLTEASIRGGRAKVVCDDRVTNGVQEFKWGCGLGIKSLFVCV